MLSYKQEKESEYLFTDEMHSGGGMGTENADASKELA